MNRRQFLERGLVGFLATVILPFIPKLIIPRQPPLIEVSVANPEVFRIGDIVTFAHEEIAIITEAGKRIIISQKVPIVNNGITGYAPPPKEK